MSDNGNLRPPWKKGESGNLKGRPKGAQTAAKILNKILQLQIDAKNPITGEVENLTADEHMWLRQMAKALNGDGNAVDRIYDRLEGPTRGVIGEVDINLIIPVSPTREGMAKLIDGNGDLIEGTCKEIEEIAHAEHAPESPE